MPCHHPRWLARPARSVAIALCLAVAGCGRLNGGPVGSDDTDVVTLTVVNHGLLDLAVFNVAQGNRERIGQVTAASSATFTLHLRRYPGGDLQLRADPIGGVRAALSERIHLSVGDAVEWTVETDVSRSFILIRD